MAPLWRILDTHERYRFFCASFCERLHAWPNFIATQKGKIPAFKILPGYLPSVIRANKFGGRRELSSPFLEALPFNDSFIWRNSIVMRMSRHNRDTSSLRVRLVDDGFCKELFFHRLQRFLFVPKLLLTNIHDVFHRHAHLWVTRLQRISDGKKCRWFCIGNFKNLRKRL